MSDSVNTIPSIGDAWPGGTVEMMETEDHGGGEYTISFCCYPPSYRPLKGREPLPGESRKRSES